MLLRRGPTLAHLAPAKLNHVRPLAEATSAHRRRNLSPARDTIGMREPCVRVLTDRACSTWSVAVARPLLLLPAGNGPSVPATRQLAAYPRHIRPLAASVATQIHHWRRLRAPLLPLSHVPLRLSQAASEAPNAPAPPTTEASVTPPIFLIDISVLARQ